MKHHLYPSVEALLTPGSLSALAGRTIETVHWQPFHSVDSKSGNRFLLVEANGEYVTRYVLKRMRLEWDWIMRATEDRFGREALAWQTGLLDQVPSGITHGVLAGAVDGPGWALLMHDYSSALIPPGDDSISASANERVLDAMAALHARFWEQTEVANPAIGFCDLRHHYQLLSLETGRREFSDPNPIPRLIVEGWNILPSLVESDVAEVMCGLADDPQPLVRALQRYPQTIIHGDWKLGNLGVVRGSSTQVVLLDWSRVGPAPPAVDLAWYLAVNSARLPVAKDVVIALYKGGLEGYLGRHFEERWWRPQLELAMLGGFLQLGWSKALGAARGETEVVRARERAELEWWSKQVRVGARWL